MRYERSLKNIIEKQQYIGECSDLETLILQELGKMGTGYLTFPSVNGRLGRILHIRKEDVRKILKRLEEKGALEVIWNRGVRLP
ncbi:MAG: hypothetical protein V1678_05235 [Candidatus Aenigmatarchaeota archaeon]